MKTDFFELNQRGTNIRTEMIAGITTFFSMAYILAVNPAILSAAGMPADAVFTATVLASVLVTLVMGLWANLPVVLSAGMGLNAFFAYTVCGVMGYSYQTALTAVFCEGVVFFLLSLSKARDVFIRSVPPFLKAAIAAAIGCFIAFIGLQNGKVIVANPATFVTIGSLKTPEAVLTLLGLILCTTLFIKQVRGAFLISIFSITALAFPLGLVALPEGFSPVSLPEKPLFWEFSWKGIFSFDFFMVFFTLFFMDIFDTLGTLIGIASQTGLVDKDGALLNFKRALITDALGTVAGSSLGCSPITSFAESSTGVAEGGKTGLTAVTAAGLFLAALFLSPVFLLIPSFATAPVLIIVGFLMAGSLRHIDFSDFSQCLVTMMTVLMMLLSYSIAEGIVFGILSFVLCSVVRGRSKDVSALIWVLSIIFLIWLYLQK